MAFIQDPRLRQTWNQLSHTTETVTSDAAAGIWTFGHRYVNPCLASLAGAVDSCTSVCLGDREERARRARERDWGARGIRWAGGGGGGGTGSGTGHGSSGPWRRSGVEYSFDFYDDWEEDYFAAEGFLDDEEESGRGYFGGDEGDGGRRAGGGGGGILRGDWDRLLVGSGSGGRSRHGGSGAGDVVDQPRRKRGMSYGTRGVAGRRKVSGEEDPNVIPRTAPLGFLGRLPFKIVGSLRYKPSAANLREHPGAGSGTTAAAQRGGYQGERDMGSRGEQEPLLGASSHGGEDATTTSLAEQRKRPRSNTTNSGDTSSSYRSRGDLFPSDGEGDEDAVPLDDEFTVALERVDDRGSTKTRSSKGKRRAGDRERDPDKGLSRTVSRTTLSSTDQSGGEHKWESNPVSPVREVEDSGILVSAAQSLEDLQREEEQAEREEHEAIERRRRAAEQLAVQRGLRREAVSNEVTEEAGTHGTVVRVEGNNHADNYGHHDNHNNENQDNDESKGGYGLDEANTEESKPPPPTTEPARSSAVAHMNGKSREASSTFVPARLPHFG
ncbi:uncharacterized protein C8A04DRAFT_24914 [Dichotomopilus funicola]|uniref:Uncharacterized protein n=1 Tax=Dichotomopilus funicola TaxID=1934379 RepID=A0AAN6V929_9PEZI|nr:hypothetical protein C8A04DRAFT_24914 [Dichotomopilus funicola]